MFGFSCVGWTIPNVLIRIVVSMILGCVIGLDRGIFSGKIGSCAYGIAGDQRGRISWSRNHHCVRASGEGTDNCGKFMGMCMRWSCSGDRVSGWWSYHYGVCIDFPSRASTSGKIFFSAQ